MVRVNTRLGSMKGGRSEVRAYRFFLLAWTFSAGIIHETADDACAFRVNANGSLTMPSLWETTTPREGPGRVNRTTRPLVGVPEGSRRDVGGR